MTLDSLFAYLFIDQLDNDDWYVTHTCMYKVHYLLAFSMCNYIQLSPLIQTHVLCNAMSKHQTDIDKHKQNI